MTLLLYNTNRETRMTDIMLMSAFDDYPELLATGSAISLIASVSWLLIGLRRAES
jgi:hypothetical protein